MELATRNARVIIGCRSKEKGELAAAAIKTETGNDNIIFKELDLSELSSVRQFAKEILEEESRLDVLINNAGITGKLL